MARKACFFLCCMLVCLSAAPCPGADVELNGYTFSDDSTELWGNPCFSSFSRRVDLGMSLTGYGDFQTKTLEQAFQQTFPVEGIECDMILERAYYPTWVEGEDRFQLDYYNGYVYYAKDTDDNIHILQMSYFMPDGSTVNWSWSDLSEVGTTLLYPARPEAGQAVFGGYVESTAMRVGDTDGCFTIVFDSHPLFPSETFAAYLQPGVGVLALSYNWEERKNGFSRDGGAPEDAEESRSTWEEWKDDHCFISACSPGNASLNGWFHALGSRAARSWGKARIALTSALHA